MRRKKTPLFWRCLSNLQYRKGTLHTYVILLEYFGKKKKLVGLDWGFVRSIRIL
jgi:hypothetical protein